MLRNSETANLSDEDFLELEKIYCETNLKYLCEKILHFGDWDKCHDKLADFLKNSKKKFKLILMPRGHLKSSVVTIALSVQEILKNPDTSILLCNAILGNAQKFLSEIKEYLSPKTDLQKLYGKFDTVLWNQSEVTISQRKKPNKTPTISTAGIETALASQHYKKIIADDLINRQTISTQEQLTKVIKFYSDCLDLLEPDGELIVIGTRWHDGDLYGELIRREKEKFDIYEASATETGKIGGQVIFPKKFSTEILQGLLKSKGSYEFYAQYFNRITNPETRIFNPPVRRWSVDDTKFIRGAITFDPATSEKKESCDAVVMVSGLNASSQLCVLGYTIFRERDKNPYNMINKIFAEMARFKIKDVIVETNGGQEVYEHLLKDESKKRSVAINVIGVHQHKSKESRILALQSYWERGDLLLKQGMVELEDQFEN